MASKIPFPVPVPGRAKKVPKVVKPEDMDVTPEQEARMRAAMEAESKKRQQESDDEEAQQAYEVRGYKKGGIIVRGVGCAARGYGKGKVY
jgi:hypothetical protein